MCISENFKLVFTRVNGLYPGCLSICSPGVFTNDHSHLTVNERKQLEKYSGRRETEYLTSRVLAKKAVRNYFVATAYNKIEITHGIFGQPILTILDSPVKLGISLAHKENLIGSLIFKEEHPVALDIEFLSAEKELVLSKILTVNEKKVAATGLFYAIFIWTAKEALSKILRCGMTAPYDFFEVSNLNENGDGISGDFLYFQQYRFISFVKYGHAITIVLPRNSQFQMEKLN